MANLAQSIKHRAYIVRWQFVLWIREQADSNRLKLVLLSSFTAKIYFIFSTLASKFHTIIGYLKRTILCTITVNVPWDWTLISTYLGHFSRLSCRLTAVITSILITHMWKELVEPASVESLLFIYFLQCCVFHLTTTCSQPNLPSIFFQALPLALFLLNALYLFWQDSADRCTAQTVVHHWAGLIANCKTRAIVLNPTLLWQRSFLFLYKNNDATYVRKWYWSEVERNFWYLW